jgi:hypothetical protein
MDIVADLIAAASRVLTEFRVTVTPKPVARHAERH